MLETLRNIVQKVNDAPDLGKALALIVEKVRQAIGADVCSVYLKDEETRELVLQATVGLSSEAVGRVRIPLYQGLVGFVCERAEPINLEDAPAHPRYISISEIDETCYHGFLGVPIIQNRQGLGVLVIQQRVPRQYEDDEVTFLFTLAAQLAGAITHARASGELVSMQEHVSASARFLQGRPGAAGVAIGRLVVVYPPADLNAVPDRPVEDPARDEKLFRAALSAVAADMKSLEKQLSGDLAAEERALFSACILMLRSESLVNGVIRRIREGNWAPGALRQTIEEHAKTFDDMEDAYIRERASDVRDLGRRILMHLQSEAPQSIEYPDNTVLVGEDVSAVQLAEVPKGRLAGVISAMGSSSSHLAILAKAMGVPAVMGVQDLFVSRLEGLDVIIDGYNGRVYVSPQPSVRAEYQRLADEDRELGEELEALRTLPAETMDGISVPLYLNTGLISEMSDQGMLEAAGVGLYRTELPFMVRDRFPSEASQVSNYQKVLKSFAPRPVTLRTLDVGGDKPLPYFPINESNPFLGWRGIRISLDHPEIFLTQVRAMLRAALGLNNLRIMLPMVSSVDEVDDAMLLIQRAHEELREEGHKVALPRIGVMIEVPSAVYQAESIARRVEFISVGTNDLTQYLLAVDRNNSHVAGLYDDMHPAVLRALLQVVEGARVYQREVCICGEMASNPAAAVLLLGMGIDCLSMSAGSLLRIKGVIRRTSRSHAQQLLQKALRYEDAVSVRRLMYDALEDMGLGGLVRPGK